MLTALRIHIFLPTYISKHIDTNNVHTLDQNKWMVRTPQHWLRIRDVCFVAFSHERLSLNLNLIFVIESLGVEPEIRRHGRPTPAGGRRRRMDGRRRA